MGLSPLATPTSNVEGGGAPPDEVIIFFSTLWSGARGVAASAVRGIVVVVRPEVPFTTGVYGRSEGLSHGAWGVP